MTSYSVGEILKAKRQAKKISLASFSRLTYINQDYLKALEANQWSKLPDQAFIKGYIKTYAQFFEFDPKPVLAIFRRDYPGKRAADKASFTPTFRLRKWFFIRRLFNGWGMATLLVVLSALAYATFQWYLSQKPPTLVIYSPEDRQSVNKRVVVRGTTEPSVKLKVNDQPVALNPDGSFETEVKFPVEGLSAIIVTATDQKGKTTEKIRYVQVALED